MYCRQKKVSSQQKQYTSEFKVENFLQVIPNPTEYFRNKAKQRLTATTNFVTEHYKFCYLRNAFNHIPITIIKSVLHTHKNLLIAHDTLKAGGSSMKFLKCPRKRVPMPQPVQDIPLLQEVGFPISLVF